MTRGIVIAAPASGCGKTVITLALLRALRLAGIHCGSLKIGPDYIDPGFHRAASGNDCRNYDPWAMRPATLENQLACVAATSEVVIAEGVTGLFDGAIDGTGSTADAAARLGWPVLLIVDVRGQGASAAALVDGFARHRRDTQIAGVVFNRVGSARHRDILQAAMAPSEIPVIAMIPRDGAFEIPDRHLGLVQASEHRELDEQIDRAAAVIEAEIDIDALTALLLDHADENPKGGVPAIPPPGQRICIARDAAFSFIYPHVVDGWRQAGAEVFFISPLADEAPAGDVDAVYLPGGYPELHAEQLSASRSFFGALRAAAERGAAVFGECGGFMVLGQSLTERDGRRFPMAGLLPIETSFAQPRLHLGYRRLELVEDGFLGSSGTRYRGHEFHYSRQTGPDAADHLFAASDAAGGGKTTSGCRRGNISGAYVHLIDRED